jgi:fluoroacetyl-CoA thioesterase
MPVETSMRTIPVGTRGRFTFVVEPAHLASEFKDPMLPPVLATPIMVLDAKAARD